MDIGSLADAAIGVLAKYWLKAAGKAAEKVGDLGAEKLVAWIKSNLKTRDARAAVEELRNHPAGPASAARASAQLQQQLSATPSLQAELAALLSAIDSRADVQQTSRQQGAGNTNVQVSGDQNTIGDLGRPSRP